ncbi:bifunctional helix-turn-helix transcriptional regulator/GNAT family N-acetyltransferase [Pseudomonas chengduensis]|nr:GNAT family N-acetyltransferase [Pseudomonas chengduensis]MBG0844871.1 bifunctional helix-turn-helix transcriptional regulator/GNAT family N-acetyltransferase [Pseudomonas chengduensis]
MSLDPSLVDQIRSASRTMVRELGFMQSTLAGTDYSPSAVHTLLEIGARGVMTAAQLVQVLGLEKSSVSRMIAKLIQAGEIEESTSSCDGRSKRLLLTNQGKRTVEAIQVYGQNQVTTALAPLNPAQQQIIAQGVNAYAQALERRRLDTTATPFNSIQLGEGYRPGMLGRIVEMHAKFYAKHWGFGQFFESQVAAGVADFAGRLNEPCNNVWLATQHDRIVGAVAIDGQDLGNHEAHLRWFILDEGYRGGGLGRRLLSQALEFCDRQGFAAIQLWTFKGLDAARTLYEASGFMLAQEKRGTQWGTAVTEQQFTRRAR